MRISDWSSDVCSSDLGDLRFVLRDLPGLGLAELHDLAAAALHRVEQEQEHADQQDHRQEAEQKRRKERTVLGVDIELDGGLCLAQLGGQRDGLGSANDQTASTQATLV